MDHPPSSLDHRSHTPDSQAAAPEGPTPQPASHSSPFQTTHLTPGSPLQIPSRPHRDRSSLAVSPDGAQTGGAPWPRLYYLVCTPSTAAVIGYRHFILFSLDMPMRPSTRLRFLFSRADQDHMRPPPKAFCIRFLPSFCRAHVAPCSQSHVSGLAACLNAQTPRHMSRLVTSALAHPVSTIVTKARGRHRRAHHLLKIAVITCCTIHVGCLLAFPCWVSWYRNTFPYKNKSNNTHTHTHKQTNASCTMQNTSLFGHIPCYLVLSLLGASSSAENACCSIGGL